MWYWEVETSHDYVVKTLIILKLFENVLCLEVGDLITYRSVTECIYYNLVIVILV